MWGSAQAQWRHSLLPRICNWLPANHVLEIGPGYGRWAKFLIDACDQYIGVDIAQNAIDACALRFASREHARFFVNDGHSLKAVPDGWADLVFSFDSLVHVEREELRSYIHELGNKLAPNGHAFLHHSNLGMYQKRGLKRWEEWRAKSVSAKTFREDCKEAGLRCCSQELIPWKGTRFIDCISILARPLGDQSNQGYEKDSVSAADPSPIPRNPIILTNPCFPLEAMDARRTSQLYLRNTASEHPSGTDPPAESVRARGYLLESARCLASFGGASIRSLVAKRLSPTENRQGPESFG
jgi:SAM-dependent methyltransferase